MATTKYSIIRNDEVIATRTSKASAIKLADESRGDVEVTVATATGTVVHTVPVLPAPGTRCKPFTRVEAPTFEAPEIEGFTPAYTRARVKAVVYRANDRSGYLVLHVPTETRVEAANTTEAREVTNALAAAHKAHKAEQAEAEKARKAEAKAAKLAAKEAEAAAEAQPEPVEETVTA